MLLHLFIKNYAIIDEVEIHFSDNLNIITGETGAGKSILLGALSLILGARADLGALRNKQQKAVIEGLFKLPENEEIYHFFQQNDLDHASETVIRREISPSGKSRAFINDTPVNLQQLALFSSFLVDLHQQFDTLQLGHTNFQLEVLDILSESKELRKKYREKYELFLQKQQEWEKLQQISSQATKEMDFDQFLFDELEEAAFLEDELEELEQELQVLTHAEDLKTGLAKASGLIEEDDPSLLQQIRQLLSGLENIAVFHQDIPALSDRIRSVSIELDDIASELQQINDEVEFNEGRIAVIQERLDTGYKLLKKHHVQTTRELLIIKNELQQKLDQTLNLDEALSKAEKEKTELHQQAESLAAQLTERRKGQIPSLVKKMNELLARVGMPNAQINVTLVKSRLRETGQDEVSFGFDANKSGEFLPLRKVASGGELSRLMLCIKSLIARSVSLPTLIFDEIESGISGEAARQVSLIMEELAEEHQVICISHQPQIAGRADTHFEVYKEEKNGRINTGIRLLSHDERIHAIAGMLSGKKPTKAALENARELVERQ